ncbi:MAG: iron dicitrate transport regulator FecR [Brevundimonas sp.]|nr:FecR domain-containing protein [uncultured Brevundimonas sp.]PZT97334.1 MAG: iron dicitrate transport regulator FecR [Brevundimonas sp.]
MRNAQETQNQAAAWIVREDCGEFSVGDREALEAWLEASDGHRAAYWRLKHGWRQADRLKALNLAGAASPQARRGRSAFRRGRLGWSLRPRPAAAAAMLAGVVLGLAGLAAVFRPVEPQQAAQFETALGGRQSVALPDGSAAVLNTASVLRTDIGGDRREVWLDAGEVFFDVRHMAGRPFRIHAGNHLITVLGTKFSVRRDRGRVSVAVLEGRVQISDHIEGRPDRSAIVSGGGVGLATGDAILVAARPPMAVEDALAWRVGLLRFDNTALGEAAAQFNRYNERPLKVQDEVAGIRIGGAFPANDPDAFARLLKDAYGLDVQFHKDSVTISE